MGCVANIYICSLYKIYITIDINSYIFAWMVLKVTNRKMSLLFLEKDLYRHIRLCDCETMGWKVKMQEIMPLLTVWKI